MKLRTLKAAALDIDGVLLSDTFSPVIKAVVEHYGGTYDHETEHRVFSQNRDAAARFLLEKLHLDMPVPDFVDFYFQERAAYVARVGGGFRVGIQRFIELFQDSGLRLVCYGGLSESYFRKEMGTFADVFECYVCTNDFRPGVREIVEDVLNLRPQEVLFVDDVARVAEAALTQGSIFVGMPASFPWGFQRREMERIGVSHLVDELTDWNDELLVELDDEAGRDLQRRFSGRVVLVTGGTSGIGREVVRLMASEGAKVAFCGRRTGEGEELQNEIQANGGQAKFFMCDVSKEAEVASLLEQTLAWGGRLDAAVNNAGISPLRSPLVDATEAAFNQVMDVNVKGVFFCLKYELRTMLRNRCGAIVNVASVLGIRAMNINHALYTASKHAVVGLTKAAALEGAMSGVRVNAVCPGGVDTAIHDRNSGSEAARQAMADLHPLRRLARPREVAETIAYLCSKASSFVTGTSLSVDGGVAI